MSDKNDWVTGGQEWLKEHGEELFAGFPELIVKRLIERFATVLRHRITILTKKETL